MSSQDHSGARRETLASTKAALFRVHVEPESGERRAWGTGFFISARGHALTAYHNLPAAVATERSGQVRGLDSSNKAITFEFVPMRGDREQDIALLRVPNDAGPFPFVKIAALPSDLSHEDRMRFWGSRSVVTCGLPFYGQFQTEELVAGHIRSDLPFGPSHESGHDEVLMEIERLRIVSDSSNPLPGISGGPVVDVDTGFTVAVIGAHDPADTRMLASALTPWPADVAHIGLPPISVLPVPDPRLPAAPPPPGIHPWTIAVLVGVLAVGGGYVWRSINGPRSNHSPLQAGSTTSGTQVPAGIACDVTVTTRLPFEALGGPHTCGYGVAGTVTPASSQPRDVILLVTAGRDAPTTQFQGRVTVAAGESTWQMSSCKGAEYSVVVVAPGALPGLEAPTTSVPSPGQDGILCVKTFEGERKP